MQELSAKDDINRMPSHMIEAWLFKYAFIAEMKGIEWAKHKSLFESLEDKKKVVLSSCNSASTTESGKERDAYKSDDYSTYLNGVSEARFNANKAYIEYSAAKDKFEALRSILSNRREEAKRGL